MTPAVTAPTTPTTTDGLVVLAELVSEYVGAARVMTARDLRAFTHPPYASLAFGAGGIAYALWRHEPTDPSVTRWLDAATRFAPEEAWLTPAYPSTTAEREPSIATGPPGLTWLRLLVAVSLGRDRAVRHWARRLAHDLGAVPAPDELLLGDAGRLLALYAALDHAAAHHTQLPALGELAERLAERVVGAASDPTRPTSSGIGLARGRLGVHHAALVAQRRRGETPREPQLDALRAIAAATPALRDLGDPLWRSWCNGTTGAVLTWVEAYRTTGDPAWVELARRDAAAWDVPIADEDDPGTLCCGSGGWAAACLALEPVCPGEGWRDRAVALAVEAFETLDSPWQHGLLRGYPGLVCLALDLASPEPHGFPLVAG